MNETENNHGESFNEDFCLDLEYYLCRTFKNSNRDELRGFWCDGIAWLPVSKKRVNDTRKIETKAWIGNEKHLHHC